MRLDDSGDSDDSDDPGDLDGLDSSGTTSRRGNDSTVRSNTPTELIPADGAGIEYAEGLLTKSELPTDVDRESVEIFVGRVAGRRIGVCGSESAVRTRSSARWRSNPENRGTDTRDDAGRTAVRTRANGNVQELYLLAEGAEDFFERVGFERTEREAMPETIGRDQPVRGAGRMRSPGVETCLSLTRRTRRSRRRW